jgi:hypothetical protein
MTRFVPILLGVLLIFFVFSCQKETSFELGQPSKGSLQNETTGDCLSKTVSGAYVAGTQLTDNHYIEVEVDVEATGAYMISTDTLNGYFFSGTGAFGQTGLQKVKLRGSGKPLAEGTDEFTVFYDSSYCYLPVTVLPAGSSPSPAQFTLVASADNCSEISLNGEFTKGVALTSTSKADVVINATSVGTYTISTNAVNGITFSGAGTIGSTGKQTISLTASGTPVNSGVHVFSVTAGNTSCSFSITVKDASTTTPSTSADHLPLTMNSWWSYDSPQVPGDTAKMSVEGTQQLGGNTYQFIKTVDPDGSIGSAYIRKSGNDYYTYASEDLYSLVTFDTEKLSPILFLKENLSRGSVWTSPVYPGKYQGQAINIKYVFKCDDNNATVTINGKTFTGVYKITITSQISLLGSPYTNEQISEEYYAKGIGKIYQKNTLNNVTGFEMQIRHWKVN